MYTYRRILAHPLRFELSSHGFGGQDNTVILKVHKIRVLFTEKLAKNVAILRLTEVIAFDELRLVRALSNPAFSSSSPTLLAEVAGVDPARLLTKT